MKEGHPEFRQPEEVANSLFDDVVGQWREAMAGMDGEALEALHQQLNFLLEKGVVFSRKDKSFILGYVREDLANEVVTAVNQNPQLVPLKYDDVVELARSKLALAVFCIGGYPDASGEDPVFVAYFGAETQPTEPFGYWEMRSSVTIPSLRRHGLNSLLKVAQMLNLLTRRPDLVPLAFTDDMPACGDKPAIKSGSFDLNKKLGLVEIKVSVLQPNLKHHLASFCPEGRCLHQSGVVALEGQQACSCSIWLPSPKQEWPDMGVEPIDKLKKSFFNLLEKEGVSNG